MEKPNRISEEVAASAALLDRSQAGESPLDQSVAESVAAAWSEFRSLVHEQLQLLALETQQAGRSLVWMIAFGVIASCLSIAAWFGTVGAMVLTLVAGGLSAPLALLCAAVANALVALAFVLAIRRRSRDLGFPATLRSIRPGARPTTVADPSP